MGNDEMIIVVQIKWVFFLTSMKCEYVMRLFSYLMIVYVEFSQVNSRWMDSN